MSNTLDPKDNNKNPSSDDARNEIISNLQLNKQFSIRQRLSMVDQMSRDQAVDTLKDLIVHMAYKEETWIKLLKQDLVADIT